METEPLQRRVAIVYGQWRVTYLSGGEVRSGLLVGPLVPDRSGAAAWVAVVPDGSSQRTMIRRELITGIAPPPRARHT